MIAVKGRVLSSPTVMYSGKAKARVTKGTSSWNMIGMNFVRAADTLPWAMLRIGAAAKISAELLDRQYNALTTSFKLCGLKKEEATIRPSSGPLMPELKRPNEEVYMNKPLVNTQLNETFSKCKPNRISMLLVILPSDDPWLYDRIKYFGDVKYGMSTLFSLSSSLAGSF